MLLPQLVSTPCSSILPIRDTTNDEEELAHVRSGTAKSLTSNRSTKTYLLSFFDKPSTHSFAYPELSAQLNGCVVSPVRAANRIPTILPYVPAIMRKNPARMTKTFHPIIARNLHESSLCLLSQLSNNHIAPVSTFLVSFPECDTDLEASDEGKEEETDP